MNNHHYNPGPSARGTFYSRVDASPNQIERNTHIAALIRGYLDANGITVRQLAVRLGLPGGTTRVYGWLGMTSAPKRDMRIALGRLMGLDPDRFKAKGFAEDGEIIRAGVTTMPAKVIPARPPQQVTIGAKAPVAVSSVAKPASSSPRNVVGMTIDDDGLATLKVDARMAPEVALPLFQLLMGEIAGVADAGRVDMAVAVTPSPTGDDGATD